MPDGLLITVFDRGGRTDLVTVPAATSEQAPRGVLDEATRPGSREHAPGILAAADPGADAPDQPRPE